MTTEAKLIKNKVGLLKLAEELGNVIFVYSIHIQMIAFPPFITIPRVLGQNDKRFKQFARANCQIKMPAQQLGTFEIRARFPIIQHDDAIDFHLFEAIGNKYSSGQLFVFKGESSFTVRPSVDGFFECIGNHTPMMPDTIAIFSQDFDITSVHIKICPVIATDKV